MFIYFYFFYFFLFFFFFFWGGGGVRKLIFFGYEDFVDIFWDWTIFRDHFYAFLGLFLRSRYTMGDIFRAFYISVCLMFLIFFYLFFLFIYLFIYLFILGGGGLTVDAGSKPTREAKMRIPPSPTADYTCKKRG